MKHILKPCFASVVGVGHIGVTEHEFDFVSFVIICWQELVGPEDSVCPSPVSNRICQNLLGKKPWTSGPRSRCCFPSFYLLTCCLEGFRCGGQSSPQNQLLHADSIYVHGAQEGHGRWAIGKCCQGRQPIFYMKLWA